MRPDTPCFDASSLHSSEIQQLRQLLRSGEDATGFQIGDALLELVPKLRVRRRLAWLSDELGTSISRLSEFQSVSRAFPANQRGDGNFQLSLLAYRIHRRMSHALRMSKVEIRDEILAMRGGRRYRQVRDHFIRLRILQSRQREASNAADAASPITSIAQRCFHGSYLQAVKQIAPASVRLIVADPPYGQRPRHSSGSVAIGTACDHEDDDEALAMTLALFESTRKCLADDGVIVLFQAGMRADRPEVLSEAKRVGLVCAYALTWLKCPLFSVPSRRYQGCYVVASERILVFSRRANLNWKRPEHNLAVPDVIYFPVEAPAAIAAMDAGSREYGDAHVYEKPRGLCRLLIETHTTRGDLVLEPFGCTGSTSAAAIELNRAFFYCESNAENFELGSRRIMQTLSGPRRLHFEYRDAPFFGDRDEL